MVVAFVFTAGDQVPVMPFVEVVGKVKAVPAHSGPIAANVGVTGWVTVTVDDAVPVPQAPTPVTVYVVVAAGVAITVAPEVVFKPVAGDHVYEVPPLAVNVAD